MSVTVVLAAAGCALRYVPFFGSLFEGDPNGGGAGRKALMQQAEASLRRLQTDYIDVYWLRNWDRTMPIEETLRGLEYLVTSGKVRYIGSPISLPGRWRKPRPSPTSAAGRPSLPFSSNTRSWSAPSKAN
jgi:hypothetical protein